MALKKGENDIIQAAKDFRPIMLLQSTRKIFEIGDTIYVDAILGYLMSDKQQGAR